MVGNVAQSARSAYSPAGGRAILRSAAAALPFGSPLTGGILMYRFTASLIVAVLAAGPAAGADEVAFPKFKVQEIETGLKVGYAVLIADLNEDGKPDIIVVDTNRVVWYENPTWKRRSIIEGKTKPDNVCITALD